MTPLLKKECKQVSLAPGMCPYIFQGQSQQHPFSLNQIDCVGTKKAKIWKICWKKWIHF